MLSITFVVLFICVDFIGGVEICRAVYPGSECQETCKEGYSEKAANFPFCFHSYKCCEAPPTTTTTTTTTTEATTSEPSKKEGCGLEALPKPVAARIVKPLLPVSLNTMDCAWPWVVSMQMTIGSTTVHACNGVLLNKNAFLTIRSCSDLLNVPDLVVKAAVGICNVSNIIDAKLEELDDVVEIEPGLSIVKFKNALDIEYSLQLLPVCLPEENTELRTDSRACVMASRSYGDPTVTSGRISVLDIAGCDTLSQFMADKPQPEGTFCTATKTDNVDACDGDEGGIVMCPDQNNRWVLKGVIQSGTCQVDGHDKINAPNQIIDIESLSEETLKMLRDV